MKTFSALFIALSLAITPFISFAQESTDDWDWEFADHFDDTEDVSQDMLQKQTIAMPNPVISGETLRILLPEDLEVNPQQIAIFDTKGSKVRTSVSLNNRNLFITTNAMSSGIYFVQVTRNVKKKIVVQ